MWGPGTTMCWTTRPQLAGPDGEGPPAPCASGRGSVHPCESPSSAVKTVDPRPAESRSPNSAQGSRGEPGACSVLGSPSLRSPTPGRWLRSCPGTRRLGAVFSEGCLCSPALPRTKRAACWLVGAVTVVSGIRGRAPRERQTQPCRCGAARLRARVSTPPARVSPTDAADRECPEPAPGHCGHFTPA